MTDHLSNDEVRFAIDAFTDAERGRLLAVACAWGGRYRVEANDLLQQTIFLALAGKRQCPRDCQLIVSLAGIMRSVAANVYYTRRRRRDLERQYAVGDGETLEAASDESGAAERESITAEDVSKMKHAVLVLFADDPDARLIVEGLMEGLDGKKLRARTSLSDKAFQSKRRLIRRRIVKAFPNGWAA